MGLRQYSNNYSRRNYSLWDDRKNMPYDYEKEGLLKHIMSHTIVQTRNPLLRKMLSFYEGSLVWVMKYVDVLRNFKNIHWKNR